MPMDTWNGAPVQWSIEKASTTGALGHWTSTLLEACAWHLVSTLCLIFLSYMHTYTNKCYKTAAIESLIHGPLARACKHVPRNRQNAGLQATGAHEEVCVTLSANLLTVK